MVPVCARMSLLHLRVAPTSCLWWCHCGSSAAVAGGPAWLRTRRPRSPTSPQTQRSPAAARWRRRTAWRSPSRRAGSPQTRSTSRSTSCPGLQAEQTDKEKELKWGLEGRVAGLGAQDAEENRFNNSRTRAREQRCWRAEVGCGTPERTETGGRRSGNWSLIKGCVEIPAVLNQRSARLLSECNKDECDSLELLPFCYTRITFSEAALCIQRVYYLLL